MEFLEKLYSQEYFAPILFTVIIILIVTFVIVFILALKDAKKSQINIKNNEEVKPLNNEEVKESTINEENKEVEFTPEVHEIKKPEENDPVISSVEPASNVFEEVQVDLPEAIEPVEQEQSSEQSLDNTIKLEESPVASTEEVQQAENELDEIAATLLKEYQKEEESPEITLPKTEEVEEKKETNEQFSSVFVTPNTLPNEEKENTIPDISDIPLPQPVRVVSQSTIIDSSKQNNSVNINDITTEEYNIKR